MKKTKKLLLIMLALIMAFAFSACVDPSDDGSDVETISVKMNIIYSEDGGAGQPADSVTGEDSASDEEKDAVSDEDSGSSAKKAVANAPENVEGYEIQVEDSATVLQILQSYADQENVEVLVDDSSTVYVTSINGVAEGESSGWIYEVNGESIYEECSKYVPADGDEITWQFINF